LGGVRFTVVHETGASGGRDARMAKLYPDTDVLVFGHSHIPWDTVTPNGLRLLNPGSPTDRRRQPFCTYQTAEIHGGEVGDVVLHELPLRR
ncbi:MAG TPA: metallophosphoesterase family protein, partial [Amycolatopsis sp.]|nr:metallophosphoesterase family protein [Amycolatopsis sp.]